MRSDISSSSPGESPHLGSPWDALLQNSLSPQIVESSQKSLREKQNSTSNQSSAFSWKHLSFRKLSLGDGDGISPLLRYRQTRFSSRRVRKRVVFKHGDVNVIQGNVAKRRRKYLQDIFTTLVDAQWRWTLLVFSLNFLLSWLLFALIWWLIALSHGDLDPKNNAVVAANLNETFENPNWVPCVVGINNFASCFLFSIETQHTIGYGGRSTSEQCPEAIFVMCVQSIVGVMIQAFMVGIVFVKLSRPIKRTHTLLFSRNAVICQRDGVLCLMFRVGDMRKSHIIEAHVRAQLIRRRITKEGELLPFYQEELKVGGDGEEDRIFFIWPTTIVHKIGPESPLYRLSAADMFRERFEIVVILEGIVESTGMTTQARSSYLPNEILWGHRFETLVSFKKETGEYEVDYSLFNNTYEVETPLCSAYTLDQLLQLNYSSRPRSEINSTDNYQLRRTSSEVLDVHSVDSRMFSENSRKLIDETEICHINDNKIIRQRRNSGSSEENNLVKNSKSLPGSEFQEDTPRSPLISLNSLVEETTLKSSNCDQENKENNNIFEENLEEITVVNPLNVPGPESFGYEEMSAAEKSCLQIKINEKDPSECSQTNQVVVKFSTTDEKEDVATPESDKSPMISPARHSCLKSPWSGNQTFSSTSAG